MHDSTAVQLEQSYFSISPLMLVPGRQGRFDVHLFRDNEFVLFAKADVRYTEAHREALCQAGIEELFISRMHEPLYREYAESNLGSVLLDEAADVNKRARLLHEASLAIVREAFDRRLPEGILKQENYLRVVEIVQDTVREFTAGTPFKTLAQFISHDYRTFSHCVHVFLYSSALLHSYNLDEETLVQAGIGAILHDIGKSVIPGDVLLKPGALTNSERSMMETHPLQGMKLCREFPLSQTARDCIMLHHEKLDGSGYPMALTAEHIPLSVRAVTIADVYDAMTTNRSYCKAMNPFQALRIMRDDMFGELDLEMFKRFVRLLSGADFV